jgi:hypothetical protein
MIQPGMFGSEGQSEDWRRCESRSDHTVASSMDACDWVCLGEVNGFFRNRTRGLVLRGNRRGRMMVKVGVGICDWQEDDLKFQI